MAIEQAQYILDETQLHSADYQLAWIHCILIPSLIKISPVTLEPLEPSLQKKNYHLSLFKYLATNNMLVSE